MLGAILRSDGRNYGEIAKGGFFWGLFVGIIAFIISLFTPSSIPVLRAIMSFIGGIIGTVLVFIIQAGIYDLVNAMIKA